MQHTQPSREKLRYVLAPLFLLGALLLQGCEATGYIRHGNQWIYAAYHTASFDRLVTPMPGVDAASFHPLNGGHGDYGADLHHVYGCGEILAGADPATFVNVGDEYWKDKSKVFWIDGFVKGADPHTFVILKNKSWARDATHAWYYQSVVPIKVRDLASFDCINDDWARDSKAYYAGFTANTAIGEVVGADYSTFHILKGSYARDRKNIYWGTRAIKDADLETFKVGGGLHLQARDRFRYYEFGKPVTKKEWETSPWR